MRISAVITIYNGEDCIGRSIESVLRQTHQPDEIIVIDDGSTDDTHNVVKKYYQSVRLIRQENGGASAARNTGIEEATGDWIAFLDGDDEWLPHHLESYQAIHQEHPDLHWSTGNYLRNLRGSGSAPMHTQVQLRGILQGRSYIQDYLQAYSKGICGCTNTMFIGRTVFDIVGNFRTDQRYLEDADMWWRIAYRYPTIGFVQEPTAVYHLGVANSLSHRNWGIQVHLNLIERHLVLSEQSGRRPALEHCARRILNLLMRSMLFQARGPDIRLVLDRHGSLFSRKYVRIMRVLIKWPGLIARACHVASGIARALRLRRVPVRKPRHIQRSATTAAREEPTTE